jgi:hypothetical protein
MEEHIAITPKLCVNRDNGHNLTAKETGNAENRKLPGVKHARVTKNWEKL